MIAVTFIFVGDKSPCYIGWGRWNVNYQLAIIFQNIDWFCSCRHFTMETMTNPGNTNHWKYYPRISTFLFKQKFLKIIIWLLLSKILDIWNHFSIHLVNFKLAKYLPFSLVNGTNHKNKKKWEMLPNMLDINIM